MNLVEQAKELFMKFAPDLINELGMTNETYEINRNIALVCIDEKIELIKFILNESTKVHQSISTQNKLCVDILNPKLNELEKIKQEIINLGNKTYF